MDTSRPKRSDFPRRVLPSLPDCLLPLLLAATLPALAASDPAVLEFIQPTNNALFSTLDEIPIVLRAFAPNDVFLSADVRADQQLIGTALYCCPLCPCAYPLEGQETTLQIPVPWAGGARPPRTWQGWTNVPAGRHWLTARAVGRNGTTVEASPVSVTVIDRTLEIWMRSDGSVELVIRQGSVVEGSYDLEASPDLRTWTRLGTFEPGDVAAFYVDVPPENARAQRFYRSVYLPPRVP
jgi:hypothetical protein